MPISPNNPHTRKESPMIHPTLTQAHDTIIDLIAVLKIEIAADRDAGIPDDENSHIILLKNANRTLKNICHDIDNTLSIVWRVDDVRKINPRLSLKKCRQVLERVERDWDASNGVTWDTLEATIEDLNR